MMDRLILKRLFFKMLIISNMLINGMVMLRTSVAAPLPQHEMRDPTRPPASISYGVAGKSMTAYGLKIDAIIIGKDRKIVVIDGQHLQIGDNIMGVEIVDIYPHAIRVKDITKEFIVNMPYADLKERAKQRRSKS